MSDLVEGKDVRFDASTIKVAYSEVLRQYSEIGRQIEGFRDQLFQDYLLGAGNETGNWTFDFFNSYHWIIASGTNEIQRNIISERVLGMQR